MNYDTVLEIATAKLRWLKRGEVLVLQQLFELKQLRQHVVVGITTEWRDVPIEID